LRRASVQQEKWAENFRERLENQKRAARKKIEEITRNGGLSAISQEAIRAALTDINALRHCISPSTGPLRGDFNALFSGPSQAR